MNSAGTEDGWTPIRVTDEQIQRIRRLSLHVLHQPFQRRSWAELGYFLVSSSLTVAAVLFVGFLGLAGILLSVILVGVALVALDLHLLRALGRWQRSVARSILSEAIEEPVPFRPRTGPFGWLRASLGDRTAWKALVYFVTKVPLTIFGVWFALSLWIGAFFGLLAPLTGGIKMTRFGPLSNLLGSGYHRGQVSSFVIQLGAFVTGIICLFVAPWAMRAVVYLDRRTMQLLLSPDAASSRIRSLEQSRSKTIDAAAVTLQRIERDLHDGTQAQLVALAMRLGQAKDKLASLEVEVGSQEIDAVRHLVDEAHRGAKEAITDLRDLARGIHPPVLDTGLENALATLAARSPVPTEVNVSIDGRPSPAIEAICYFCAAELLANVTQHAEASRASLTCAQHGPWLRIVVRDDGRGGAAVNRVGSASSGLAGLADRVDAVDGHLSIASPAGGPTVVTVDLPAHA